MCKAKATSASLGKHELYNTTDFLGNQQTGQHTEHPVMKFLGLRSSALPPEDSNLWLLCEDFYPVPKYSSSLREQLSNGFDSQKSDMSASNPSVESSKDGESQESFYYQDDYIEFETGGTSEKKKRFSCKLRLGKKLFRKSEVSSIEPAETPWNSS